MKRLLPSCFVAASAMCLAVSAHAAAVVGQPAPDFTLPDVQGESHSLSDYAGKIVVLEWVNHGCPYVRKHYNSHNMPSLQEKYTGEGVVWLSICSSAPGEQGNESPAQWQALIEKKPMHSTAVLLDETGGVGKLYGAKTTPHMFVINPEGVLEYNGAIDSIASTRMADIEKADNYVVDAIAAIQAGEPVKAPTSRPYGCGVKYARDS